MSLEENCQCGKALLPIQLIEHGKVKQMPTESFHPYVLGLWYRKVLCMLPKEKCEHKLSYKPSDIQWCTVCKIC